MFPVAQIPHLFYRWLPIPLSHHSYPQNLHGLVFPPTVVPHICSKGSTAPLEPKTHAMLSETGAGTKFKTIIPLVE